MNTKISIVIPVYNNEKYFPLAINSILNQEYTNWEIIIVDDGSTDLTGKLADKLAENDDRIRVIHQKNQWIYASMNNGIDESKGEYVYILNSDDCLRPGSLKLLAKKVNEYNAPDIIWTKVLSHICDSEQKIIDFDFAKMDKKVSKEGFYQNRKVKEKWPFFLESGLAMDQANLYKKELIKKHKFRNDVYGADTLFNIDIAQDVKTAVVIKEAIYDHFIYQVEGMNISVGKYYSYQHDMYNEIYSRYIDLFREWNIAKNKYIDFLSLLRLKWVTKEIRSLSYKNCNMEMEEKVNYILNYIIDKTVFNCAEETNRLEELESRILSGLRELFIKERIHNSSDMYFVYEMLEAMLCYEKDKNDYDRMKKAIYHPLNPYHIGKTFYEKLTKMNL